MQLITFLNRRLIVLPDKNNKLKLEHHDRYFSHGRKVDRFGMDNLNPAGREIQEERRHLAGTIATVKPRKVILGLSEPEDEQLNTRDYFKINERQFQGNTSTEITKYRFQYQHLSLKTEAGMHGSAKGKDEVDVVQIHAALNEPNDGSSSSISEFGDGPTYPKSNNGTRANVMKVEELSSSGSSTTADRGNGMGKHYSSVSIGNRDARGFPGPTKNSNTNTCDEETCGSIISPPFSNLSLLESKQQRFDLATATSLPSAGSISISSHISDEIIPGKKAGPAVTDVQVKPNSKYRK